MKLTGLIDLLVRRLNSVLFRLVICSYALYIILTYNNIMPEWIYFILVVGYFVLYVKFLKAPKIRLINDFLFIFIILLYKNPVDPITYIFITLPIINSINFSGEKKSKLLYLYSISLFFGLLCIYHKSHQQLLQASNLKFLFPIVALWVINSYTSVRVEIRNFREMLNDLVDDYFLHPQFIKQPHKIYSEIITAINARLNKEFISEIYCFMPSRFEKKPILVNGSRFLWKYEFFGKEIEKRLNERQILHNESMSFDGKVVDKSIMLYSKIENQDYYYIFITKSELPFPIPFIGFPRILSPVLTRISKVLFSERSLHEIRNAELSKLMQSVSYVNKANKTMHFVRNRLGPFSNLLAMLDASSSIPVQKAEQFNRLLVNERERTELDLRSIVSRANDMLEKSNNPFIYTNLVKISVRKLFVVLKRLFNNHFPETEIELLNTSDEKLYVHVNEEGMEVFLSDWISNMKKYKKSIASCVFSLDDENLKLIFKNDHFLNQEDVNKMISDLTSNERNEIMRRTTHGLYIIKTTLEDMGLLFDVYCNANTNEIEFTLTLKITKDESSGI